MIKAQEIINKQFSRAFWGYDIGEVDEFLDEIVRANERAEQELEIAQLRIKMLLEELTHYTGKTMDEQETLQEQEATEAPAEPEAEQSLEEKKELTLEIRYARPTDIDAITAIEATCFLPAEAASRERFEARLQAFPRNFWVAEADGKVIGIINGMVTMRRTIVDDMFEHATLHDAAGEWQSVMGIAVLPEHQRQGIAAELMQTLISDAKAAGRKGCTLTCKERLLPYYAKFGYKNEGISASQHGGAVWYDMVLEFATSETE